MNVEFRGKPGLEEESATSSPSDLWQSHLSKPDRDVVGNTCNRTSKKFFVNSKPL
jgi:hypothetical protein